MVLPLWVGVGKLTPRQYDCRRFSRRVVVSTAELAFPATIPSPLGGQLNLKFKLPRVHCVPSRPFAIYWSDTQRYGQLYPQPSPDELARFYGFSEYDTYLAGGSGQAAVARRTVGRRIAEAFVYRGARLLPGGGEPAPLTVGQRLAPQSVVCDVGCGSGVMLQELANLGHKVVGVEPSAPAREVGNARGIEIVEGSGEDLTRLAGRQFDLVSMIHSLEHTYDPIKSLAGCAALLKPGGLLWVEVPNHDCYGFLDRGPVWFHTDAGRHMHYFTASSLQGALKLVGLQPIETGYYGYTRQFGWLDAEKAVWDSIYSDPAAGAALDAPPAPGSATLLKHFVHTALSNDATRCDSLRVIARKVPA
jgi:SAM-dependent methyltransferase